MQHDQIYKLKTARNVCKHNASLYVQKVTSINELDEQNSRATVKVQIMSTRQMYGSVPKSKNNNADVQM